MDFKHTNHLKNEKSPYLLQHIHNPVDWFPWGNEAFEKAKREDKPIFLSIGYSTCHWCHVMENESFEDEETAEILNADFISIKVDREERPDVDAVYMAVCTAMTGSGGWPMTIIMTAEQKPFFAGTYFPKKSRYGMMGLDDLLLKVAEIWRTDRKSLLDSAEKITDHFKNIAYRTPIETSKSDELISSGISQLKKSFDKKNGGFGSAPKFPTPHNLLFLMKNSQLESDGDAFEIAEKTLIQMYRGGIFDHIGGGFSRYSTDEKWLAPHFEKMLYDNALLIYAYISAFEISENKLFKSIAERTIDYVLRELTHSDGGFFCGQDADSEGVEGKFYVFTPDEISAVLGGDADEFCKHFDITAEGNFEGKSIANLLKNESFSKQENHFDEQCRKLYDFRQNRTKLHKDDKVLTSWNSLMICALAKAYRVLGDEKYLAHAIKCYRFIEENLTQKNGRLKVRWRDGDSIGDGKIDDYAFYSWALLELYESTFEVEFLSRACEVSKLMCCHFFDEENGGFYLYSDDGEQLLSRPKESYDGAIPSGNSVAGYVLGKLFSLTADNFWREKLDKQMSFLSSEISGYPLGFSFALFALQDEIYPRKNLIVSSSEAKITDEILGFLRENKNCAFDVIIKTQENSVELEKISPLTAEYPIPKSGAKYYLCKNGACQSPVDELNKLL